MENVCTFTLRLSNGYLFELPKPAVMGIINTSPNSFYNPHLNFGDALSTVDYMVAAGANILDIGGEATNPFVDIEAEAPSVQNEVDRVAPLVAAIKKRFDILVSVDTSRPAVMREVVKAGADIINDQRALCVADAMLMVATLETPVCLMHFAEPHRDAKPRDPATLLQTIKRDLSAVIQRCERHGITRDRIIIDPGFGQGNFGKNCAENYYLLANLHEFTAMGFPLLAGWSRKSMVGDTLGGVSPQERLYGSIAAETLAAFKGAAIIRTHDVKAVADAIKVANCMMEYI